jgi:tRNA A-37 threonylcarbamoyl transferase component Bud32
MENPSERCLAVLKPGDVFRDWLVEILGTNIDNDRCEVEVYRLNPASHTVCRYNFSGEEFSVVGKFYSESIGWKNNGDPSSLLRREFNALKKLRGIIDVPKAIAIRDDFNCVLVTEYIEGDSFYRSLETEIDLYGCLTKLAKLLRSLHKNTKTSYHKEGDFANFHRILDGLHLDRTTRENYNRILGDWWHSTILDQPYGCMIHNDTNPANYLVNNGRIYMLDLESFQESANFVRDLATIAAEIKRYFVRHKGCEERAEQYIGHFLWNYAINEDEFLRITRMLPFFMSLDLFILTNMSDNAIHRDFLFKEADSCLNAIYSKNR